MTSVLRTWQAESQHFAPNDGHWCEESITSTLKMRLISCKDIEGGRAVVEGGLENFYLEPPAGPSVEAAAELAEASAVGSTAE